MSSSSSSSEVEMQEPQRTEDILRQMETITATSMEVPEEDDNGQRTGAAAGGGRDGAEPPRPGSPSTASASGSDEGLDHREFTAHIGPDANNLNNDDDDDVEDEDRFEGHGDSTPDDWYQTYEQQQRNEEIRKVLFVAGAIVFSLALLIGIILFATSFTGVERQHFGIRYNPHSGRIDGDEVYDNGNHFWSPAAEALQYPAFWRRVALRADELEVAVSSGQVLRLELAFRYQFKKDTLMRIVRRFGQKEELAVRATAINAVKNAAPGFTFQQYVQARDAVMDGLHAVLVEALRNATIDVTVPRPTMILGYVDLPPTVLELNQQVFYQSERRIQNEFEKQAQVVRLETQLNRSRIEANATEVEQAALAVKQRMQEAAAHNGTAQLHATSGGLLLGLAERLGVATRAGYQALSQYSLVLSALEGGQTEIGVNVSSTESERPTNMLILEDAGNAVIPEA